MTFYVSRWDNVLLWVPRKILVVVPLDPCVRVRVGCECMRQVLMVLYVHEFSGI